MRHAWRFSTVMAMAGAPTWLDYTGGRPRDDEEMVMEALSAKSLSENAYDTDYRVYHDDWGIWGHTPEARVVQSIPWDIDVHLRYRLHHQSRADFYRVSYPTADPAEEPYLTDDVKLSRLTKQTIGAKVDLPMSLIGAQDELADARLETLFEYIFQTTYYGNAVVAQIAVTVPFGY